MAATGSLSTALPTSASDQVLDRFHVIDSRIEMLTAALRAIRDDANSVMTHIASSMIDRVCTYMDRRVDAVSAAISKIARSQNYNEQYFRNLTEHAQGMKESIDEGNMRLAREQYRLEKKDYFIATSTPSTTYFPTLHCWDRN